LINFTASRNQLLRNGSLPIFGRDVKWCVPILHLKMYVTASFNQLLSLGCMPLCCCTVERSGPILHLKINVTASFNQLLRDGRMPFQGCEVERRVTILRLKVYVTARFNQLFRDGLMSISGREVERGGPIRVLGVDQGLRAGRRQERPNSYCIAFSCSNMNVHPSCSTTRRMWFVIMELENFQVEQLNRVAGERE